MLLAMRNLGRDGPRENLVKRPFGHYRVQHVSSVSASRDIDAHVCGRKAIGVLACLCCVVGMLPKRPLCVDRLFPPGLRRPVREAGRRSKDSPCASRTWPVDDVHGLFGMLRRERFLRHLESRSCGWNPFAAAEAASSSVAVLDFARAYVAFVLWHLPRTVSAS